MRAHCLLLATALLTACSSAAAFPTASRTPTAPAITATPTSLPSPTLTPEPTVPPCRSRPGTIRTGEIEDPALTRTIPYRIYLPPCYAELPLPSYPTLYLLHGLASTDSQWDELGIDETATRLIQAGVIPPLLIVMPWERRGLDYLTAVPDVLVPAIERLYRASPERSARAIGGLSRGAGWALRIGLQRPDVFAAIGLHSPAVLTPDLYYVPDWLEAIPSGLEPSLWIDIGDRDPLRPPTEELRAILDQAGYPYEWTLDPGRHEAAYWIGHLETYLRWYTQEWTVASAPGLWAAPARGLTRSEHRRPRCPKSKPRTKLAQGSCAVLEEENAASILLSRLSGT